MENDNLDDAGLWENSLQGDGDSFGILFDRHRDRVFRHAARLSGNQHEAEDIMAASFLELWRRRDNVRLVDGSVLPWLLVTTTNVALNVRRATARYCRFLDSLPRSGEGSGSLDEPSHQDSIDRDVALALGALNSTDLRLVSLVVFEEYPIAAAATILKLKPGTAKTRLHRARLRMKAAIKAAIQPQTSSVLKGERS